MSTASSYTAASYSQSVCQTTAFIGSGAAHGSCRDTEAEGGFTENLAALMQVPVSQTYTVSAQLTTIVTEAGVGCTVPNAPSPSSDSIMQLLQGLESEIATLSGELRTPSGASATSGAACGVASGTASGAYSGATHAASGLHGDYQTLYGEAVNAVQDGTAFDVTLPSGETLSGKFSGGELEPGGDEALFAPGNTSAPDAGKQAFDNAIEQFLSLAQSASGSASASGQIANYNTTASFTGSDTSALWSGSFSLAPADAIPKS